MERRTVLSRLVPGRRRSRGTRRAGLAGAVVLALALGACSSSPEASEQTDEPGEGQTASSWDSLRVVDSSLPTSLDPDSTNINDIYVNFRIAGHYMGTLVRIRPSDDSGDPLTFGEDLQPELAETMEAGPDGYTFTLRDMTSPSGNPLTSEDVKWSFERMAANATVAYLLLSIANVDMENPVTVQDEKTFTINTTSSTTLLPAILDNAAIGIYDSTEAKKHATDEDPWAREWLKTNVASYGAYTISSLDPGESVTLAANPNYWSGEPEIGTITVQAVPDAASRTQLLQGGSADLVFGVPPVEWNALQANSDVQTMAMDSPSALEIWFNTQQAPTDDPELRQAIAAAINKEDIATGLFAGVATAAAGCSASTVPVPGFENAFPVTGDPAAAEQALSGVSLDRPLRMIYNSAANVFSEDAARFVQDQLRQVGVEVELQAFATQAEYQAAMDKKEWDLNLGVNGLFVNHPLYELKMFLTGDSSLNIPGYHNEEFVALVDQALSSQGADADAATVEACELAINEDVPMVVLMNYPFTVAGAADLGGIRSYPYDRLPFADLK